MLKAETTARLRRAALEFLTIVTGVLTALALDGTTMLRSPKIPGRWLLDRRTPLFPARSCMGRSFSGGTYHPPRLFNDATYQDLVSTGNFRLIRDQRLRGRS